jgi:hypothetical protein
MMAGFCGLCTIACGVGLLWTGNGAWALVGFLSAMLTLGFAAETR